MQVLNTAGTNEGQMSHFLYVDHSNVWDWADVNMGESDFVMVYNLKAIWQLGQPNH